MSVNGFDRAAHRHRLAVFLLGTGRVSHESLAADAALITSGLIDSVVLFNLALWIEETIGAPVDITRLDLPAQWDTPERILDFIAAHGRAPD